MSFQTYQGQPVQIDLVANARTTGWRIEGINAIHDSCNTGEIELLGFIFLPGKTYDITYFINSISNGYVQPLIGTAAGQQATTSGFKQDTITITGSVPRFRFLSNANTSIKFLTIRDTSLDTELKQKNSIAYSNITKKWPYYLTYVPDCGASIYTNTYTCKNGKYYVHQHGSAGRNNFGGVQYKSIVTMVFNANAALVKTFLSVSLQSNQLMVTTEDGIKTSLGQISELIDADFLKETLTSGSTAVNIYGIEGLFSAMLLRDKNIDLLEGDPLKGNYITIQLVSTEDEVLRLFTVQLSYNQSHQGVR